MSGYGKFVWADGDYFIGNFKDGKREKGKLFYSNEKGKFDADWENNGG